MYPSVEKSDNLKSIPDSSASAPPLQAYGAAPALGIPVNSTNQTYSSTATNSAEPTRSQDLVPWSSGLCSCGSDIKNCCITCWCPCITFGQISEIVDRGGSSCGANGAIYALIMYLTGCQSCFSCFYRSKMRQQYHLEEGPCMDCLVHCCCESCALCQEYRELESRGYDMSLGWHGNVEKKNREAAMPPLQQGMSR